MQMSRDIGRKTFDLTYFVLSSSLWLSFTMTEEITMNINCNSWSTTFPFTKKSRFSLDPLLPELKIKLFVDSDNLWLLYFCLDRGQAPSATSQTVRYNLRSSRNQVSRLFVAVVLYQIWLSSGSGSPRCSSICTPARCRATCASCLVAGTWGWPALNVTTFPNVPSWDGRSVPI